MCKVFESQLEQFKIEQKDILRTKLLLEENFLRMINKGNAAQVKVQVTKNFFGKVQLRLSSEGVSYNPLVEISDWQDNDEDENYFNEMILNAHRDRLTWRRKQNLNVVTINVPDKSSGESFVTAACVIGGIVCGVLMKETLSPEMISFVKENIIMPTQTMFLNALNLLIAPVIFLSIVDGVTDINTGSGTGKIGLKLIGCSLCLMIVSVVLSYGVAWIFFGSDATQLGTAHVTEAEGQKFSAIKFIVTASVMFLRTCGVELDLYDFVLIAFLAMMFSFGAPDFISITTIVGHFGVPMEIATLIFCIDALSDRLGTCVNVLSNMTATLTLARTENLVDEKIYFRD